jgi:hypothetical protein
VHQFGVSQYVQIKPLRRDFSEAQLSTDDYTLSIISPQTALEKHEFA